MINKFKFYREDTRWYVDLPEFIRNGGSKADLEMVLGADELLEELSKGRDTIHLSISTDENELLYDVKLDTIKREDGDNGATYVATGAIKKEMTVWLCPVVLFVYKDYPEEIYVQVEEGCIKCGSNRLSYISGKCNDGFYASIGEKEIQGYVASDMNLSLNGDSDYISFEYCLNCGQIQAEFPLKDTHLETGIDEENEEE